MKKSIILFAAGLLTATAFAQSPQKMSYQSVIRNATDDLLTETTVGIQISILQGTSVGTAVYVETHEPLTNINGLVSLELGMGTPVTGTFADIDWGNGPYFIKSDTDPDGGTSYTLSGVSELLSVPYALYASGGGDAAFTTSGNVTSNTLGDLATDDFLFGSSALDDDGNSDHDARMFFDKSKAAFRAGTPIFNQWDEQNVGFASTAMGSRTIASGSISTAMGYNTIASGESSTATGFITSAIGDYSTAMGDHTSASGLASTAMGMNTSALSYAETVLGGFNTTYSPQSVLDWHSQDRLFVIGNGESTISRSNAMVVLKNGNVGLGTSTPNELLEIAGSGRAFFGDGQGSNRKGLLIDGIHGEGAARIEAYDYETGFGLDLVLNTVGNGNVGIRTNAPTAALSVNGSANKTGGGSWAVFSDRRLKKDIRTYDDGLSAVLAIDPVTFKYNGISDADTINTYVGVIAQELEKVSPYMINTIELKGTEYLEVDNSAMTYMLINAIQELNDIIASQRQLIHSQGAAIDTLNTENADQEAALKANTVVMLELQSILHAQANK